ncbi:hypothetical protein Trydic_g1344 [Trypoxylus dichotomus]
MEQHLGRERKKPVWNKKQRNNLRTLKHQDVKGSGRAILEDIPFSVSLLVGPLPYTVLRLISYSVNFPVLSLGNRKYEFHRVIRASEKFSHEPTRRRYRRRLFFVFRPPRRPSIHTLVSKKLQTMPPL